MKSPSIADIAAQLEAHAAFLKTPEGKEWEIMNREISKHEGLDLLRRPEPNPETATLYEKLREMSKGFKTSPLIPTGLKGFQDLIPPGGFKRGELLPLVVYTPPECKSNLMFHTILKMKQQNPDLKIVFPVSFEHDAEYFDEDRFKKSLEAMGIEYTNPSEQKETKQ
ncbi:hypothetical protein [Burkholderia phage FLC9]|nr:hypothetical protein [Burkholderia phage FLC9]